MLAGSGIESFFIVTVHVQRNCFTPTVQVENINSTTAGIFNKLEKHKNMRAIYKQEEGTV